MDKLKPCPFCGCYPYLAGDGDWQGEYHYVEMRLECCIDMRFGIGWREARDMTKEERNKRMIDELTKRWNERFEV